MPRIFISYRRADSQVFAGRLYDRLENEYGSENIFKDVDKIPLGEDFRSVIQREIGQSDVMLVVIGNRWLNITSVEGIRRLDDPNDPVRIEVETGLAQAGLLVIPVLVDNSTMPVSTDLPHTLSELAFKNAAVVRNDPDFRRDMTRLVNDLNERFSLHTEPPNLPTAETGSTQIESGKKRRWVIPAVAIVGALATILLLLIGNGVIRLTPLDAREVAMTQAAELQIAAQNTATIEYLMTSFITETVVANSNATADAVTVTPTIEPTEDISATINARATLDAQATANVPTDTPQPTSTSTTAPTYTPTPTITPTPDVGATQMVETAQFATAQANARGTQDALGSQPPTPLKIGLLTDQSGPLTIYGTELENGFKLGLIYAAGLNPADYTNVDEALAAVKIAGRPAEVLIRDTASNVDSSTTTARDVVRRDGAEILVGAPSSAVTVNLQQIAIENNVLLFAAPGASPDITGEDFNLNTFRACRNTMLDTLALASFATSSLGTKWVILATDSDFGRSSAASYWAALGAYGIELVSDIIYLPSTTTDFTAYLQQVLDSSADVFLPIWIGDTTANLYQQIESMNFSNSMTVITGFNSNDIVAFSDTSLIGAVGTLPYHYSFPQNGINNWLTNAHKQFFNGDVPDLFTECGFATAQALFSAVSATDGSTRPADLIPHLEGLVWEGPKGTYYLRPGDHQTLMPMYIAQLANVDDPTQDYYDLLATIPALDTAPPCLLPSSLAARCALNDAFVQERMG